MVKRAATNLFDKITQNRFKGGYSRVAAKNSIYQFATSFVSRFGGLLLTVIMVRLLLPEIYGLYSLVLSTILIFISIADSGFNQTLIRFISRSLGKGDEKKAKAYFNYILKWKLVLLISVSAIVIIFAKFIAIDYYQKPIFLSIIVSVLYLVSMSLLTFLDSLFNSANNFKIPFYKEIISQIVRLILVPLVIVFSLKIVISQDVLTSIIFLSLAVTYFISIGIMIFFIKKQLKFLSVISGELSSKEKAEIRMFLGALSAFFLSGFFFSYIDIIILGRMISAEYIGYYKAAFNLATSIAALIMFPTVILQIFSRINGKRLEKGLNKSLSTILLSSLILFIISFILSSNIIETLFPKYLASINLFKVLCLLIIIFPLTSIYENYFIARSKPKIVAILLVCSTILTLILIYLAVIILRPKGPDTVILGAGFAIIIARTFYLGSLIITKRLFFKSYKLT